MTRACKEVWRYDHVNAIWLSYSVKWFDGRIIKTFGKPKARTA